MINEKLELKKYISPFPYIKIKNFLSKKYFNELEKNFPSKEDFQKNDRSVNRMDFDTTYGDELYNNLIKKNQFYSEFHEYIYSSEFINFFLNLFQNDIKIEQNKGSLLKDIDNFPIKPEPHEVGGVIGKHQLNKNKIKFIYPRLDIGLGIEGYGKNNGGGGIHVDNPQRIISILFYLGGFKDINGGDHRIWKKNDEGNGLKLHESIKPEKNLLIAALQTNFAFHDVDPIKKITGSRNAFYIAISTTVPSWKQVKNDKFNIKYNKNRVKLSFIQKVKKKLFQKIS